MQRLSLIRKLSALGVFALAALVMILLSGTSAHADHTTSQSVAASTDAWKNFFYQEAKDCKTCHTAPTDDFKGSLDLCMFTEYSIWKTHDKHAQAFAVLKGERGRKIAALLYPNKPKEEAEKSILELKAGCLGCHAMGTLPAAEGAKLDIEDGVSCTGCHGPSGGQGAWFGPHQQKKWRKETPETKYKAGERDLRDPLIRAELCVSCHIGNADEGKVVTHAMMAAGHPPLPPIEMATFSKNEPQHWRDAKDVPFLKSNLNDKDVVANFHLEDLPFQRTKQALVGNVIAIREAFKLLKSRSDFANAKNKNWTWPELNQNPDLGEPEKRWSELALATADCFACHHDLKYPGFRQARGFSYHVPGVTTPRVIPGRPMVRSWPLAGLNLGIKHAEKPDDFGKLATQLKQLTEATNAQPFGNPKGLATSADGLIGWSTDLAAAIRSKPFTRENVRELARNLCKLYPEDKTDEPDYETARQLGSLLAVACADLGMDTKTGALADLQTYLNTEPYQKRGERLAEMEKVLRTALGKPVDMTKFKEQLKEFGDQKSLEGLIGNEFLRDLRDLGNAKFTAALLEKSVSDKFQQLSDEEEKIVLKTISNYSPREFRKKLDAVAATLK
jgi:hypothetical protein